MTALVLEISSLVNAFAGKLSFYASISREKFDDFLNWKSNFLNSFNTIRDLVLRGVLSLLFNGFYQKIVTNHNYKL